MEFYSSGKLMLTGEYVVLAGATALSIPTKRGQTMQVTPANSAFIHWKSIDHQGNCWFENEFSVAEFSVAVSVNSLVEDRLSALFKFIYDQSSVFDSGQGFDIVTTLEFDRLWGLGSSSTLVANLAKWAEVDPIDLLHAAFRGSGYDVATGLEDHTILYQIENGVAHWEQVTFQPDFSHQIFFVYLGEKKISEDEVLKFDAKSISAEDVALFNDLTDDLMTCETLTDFSYIMTSHERELSDILNRPTIKYQRFRDYPFAIKSLGGWGGDFILVVGNPDDQDYFKEKGYDVILSWDEMIQS